MSAMWEEVCARHAYSYFIVNISTDPNQDFKIVYVGKVRRYYLFYSNCYIPNYFIFFQICIY